MRCASLEIIHDHLSSQPSDPEPLSADARGAEWASWASTAECKAYALACCEARCPRLIRQLSCIMSARRRHDHLTPLRPIDELLWSWPTVCEGCDEMNGPSSLRSIASQSRRRNWKLQPQTAPADAADGERALLGAATTSTEDFPLIED